METWFGLESPHCDYDNARVVIVPAPYEGTVSWGQGALFGPAAVLDASPNIEYYDSILGTEPYLMGIHGLPSLDLDGGVEAAVMKVKDAVAGVIKAGKCPVLVGGEHSLTVGAVMAAFEAHLDLTVLQIDAHADLRDEYEDEKFSHACVMRRIHDLGIGFVQAGIRSMSVEEREWLDNKGRDVISSRYIRTRPDWLDHVLSGLSNNIYLTFDVDGLDPSEMPATGTPEPGGLSYHHVIDLVLALKGSGKKVVGFDIMELAPIEGLHHPQFTCASLMYTMMGAFWGE